MATKTRKPSEDSFAIERSVDEINDLITAPFDDDVVEHIERGDKVFSNVAPQHYIHRLREAFGPDLSVTFPAQPIVWYLGQDPAVVTQLVRIENTGEVFPGHWDGVGAEPVDQYNPEHQRLAFAFKSAASDGIKIASKVLGLGLHLYDSPAETIEREIDSVEVEAPAEEAAPATPPARRPFTRRTAAPAATTPAPATKPAPRAAAPAAPAAGGVTGDEICSFGKFNNQKASDMEGSWLQWAGGAPTYDEDNDSVTFEANGGLDPGPRQTFVRKEIARRLREGSFDPEQGNERKPRSKPAAASGARGVGGGSF